MREYPLVSIIISSYNYGRFLRNTIDSALSQTYGYTEVIIVDDGSTDNSPEIIDSYGNQVIPILKENGGQASAFNAGFTTSRGEVVVFLDSDDMLLPTAIEKAVKAFGPTVSKVHWPLWKIDADGKRTGELDPKFPLAEGNYQEQVIQNGPNSCGGPPYSPPTSGIAWSRTFLNQIFPIPEAQYKSCTDQYLFVLAPLFGEIRAILEPQGCYRVHGKNYSANPLESYVKESILRYENSCQIVSRYLGDLGVDVNPESWPRNTWYHQINAAIEDIKSVVPCQSSFMLVDGNHWATGDTIAGRRVIPFMEKDNDYWGEPSDEASAIQEIKRQRKNGIPFIVFVWTNFWYLQYHQNMHQYLRSTYKCILENERIIAFHLN